MSPTLLSRPVALFRTAPEVDGLSPAPKGRTGLDWVWTTLLVGVVALAAVAAWPARHARTAAAAGGPGGPAAREVGPRVGGWPLSGSAAPRREDEMDAEMAAARVRIFEKEAVAAALVRGDVTAGQAADRFRQMLAQEPKVRAALRLHHPEATDGDLGVYMLINFVNRVGWTHPAGTAPVLAELQAAVARPGPELVAAVGVE
jgi:hypothetical protein